MVSNDCQFCFSHFQNASEQQNTKEQQEWHTILNVNVMAVNYSFKSNYVLPQINSSNVLTIHVYFILFNVIYGFKLKIVNRQCLVMIGNVVLVTFKTPTNNETQNNNKLYICKFYGCKL